MTKNLTRRQIQLMMATLLLGSFITTLAETLMNNGIPMIMKETHVTQMDAQWLNTGYMLVAGMVMPLASYCLHRFPLKQLFTATMSSFLLGTLVAVFAPNYWVLLVGRLIQALAVGINMPLVTNVLTIIIPQEHRGLAIGIAGIIINLGPAIGPTLSGLILQFYNWRMLFIILLPITILTIICTQWWVHDVVKPQRIVIDSWSAWLAIFGLGSLLYALGRIGIAGSNFWLTIIIIVVGLVLMGIFVHRQLRITNPLLKLSVFKYGQYRLGMYITLLSSAAIMAPELMLPLFNQNVLKVSPIISGAVMIPSSLAMSILSPLAGRLYDDFGIKRVSLVGGVIGLAAALPMFFYNVNTTIALITILYAFRCAGLTLSYTPANVYALNALPQNAVVSGNTIITTLIQVANSFGTALAASTQNLVQVRAISRGLSTTIAMVKGYQWSFFTTIVISLLALLLTFRVGENTR